MDRNLTFENFIVIPWTWVAPSMSLKSHSNARNFFFDGFKNELRHLCPLNRIQIFETIHCNTLKMNHWMFLWEEFMDRRLILKHILTNIFWTKTFKISLRYLENELRHLCPSNCMQFLSGHFCVLTFYTPYIVYVYIYIYMSMHMGSVLKWEATHGPKMAPATWSLRIEGCGPFFQGSKNESPSHSTHFLKDPNPLYLRWQNIGHF